MMSAVLSNPGHPDYGVATIPFPIPHSVFKARKKTPLTYQEVSGANVLPLTEIFSKYFS